MKISFCKYLVELKHQFRISSNSRKFTPIVIVRIEHDGLIGFGEASLPPYLDETQESVISFIQKVSKKLPSKMIGETSLFHDFLEDVEEGNNAAKASLDIAYHDLLGKMLNKPIRKFFTNDSGILPHTSMTIGIDEEVILKKKIEEASAFKILKIKLGSADDKKIINIVRKYSDKPLFVDVNQGWTEKETALEMINWLCDKNVLLIEQPMPKNCFKEMLWLKERSSLPLIADESVQRLTDIEKVKNCFHGINIKLMKCSGLFEANQMIEHARKQKMKVMLGCMTETSCGISAAIQLASLVDYADLDGNCLIANDPFATTTQIDGKLVYPNGSGLGIIPKVELNFEEVS